MVVMMHSLSSKHTSLEVELEGIILQHTAAVDYYLETAAAKWTLGAVERATPRALREVFLADLKSTLWQESAQSRATSEIRPFDVVSMPHVRAATVRKDEGVNPVRRPKRRPRIQPLQASYDSRLQQYLQQQAQHVQPQLHNGFSNLQLGGTLGEIPGAVSSSCSSTADPVIACGQLQTAVPPALVQHAATGAGAASHAVTGFGRVLKTQAVADALPGCNSASTATATVPAEEWTTTQAISNAPAGTAYAPCAKAAPLSESADARGPAAAPSAVVAVATATAVVNLETDDELLAQKKAARARLAELEGTTAPAGSSAAAEVASKASAIAPVAAEGLSDTAKQTCAGASSVHNCAVPQRPRPLVGKLQMASCSADTAFGEGQTAMLVAGPVMQPCRFTQALTAGLLMCLMLLATSWWLQLRSAAVGNMQYPLLWALQQYSSYLYVAAQTAALLYTLSTAWSAKPPLLYFVDPVLEAQYLDWSNTGKLFVDCMFQVLFLVVGSCLWLRMKHTGVGCVDQTAVHATTLLAVVSMLGSGLPVMLLLLLRSVRYLQWREQLIAGSKLCSVAVLASMQLSLPADSSLQLPYGTPFVALAQLMGLACMQVRLATFVPCQVAYLLVLLFKIRAANPLLHFAQLFGGGLCLPCLLLRSMEIYSRKAFLAAVASTSCIKQKQL